MTAVAAVLVNDTPVLVGDVVLSSPKGERLDYTGKVYEVGTNVVIGWSGAARVAQPAISRLRREFSRRFVSADELRDALNRLADLRGRATLELTGWIVTAGGPKVIRWATHYEPVTLSDSENAIGDGGDELRKLLAEPEVGAGNTEGYDRTALKVVTGFIEARFEEMLRPEWPQTWGAAFDVLVLQESRFRWLPSLTYVGWDLTLDDDDRITDVAQAPVVFKQERIHGCTLLLTKRVGGSRHEAKVSTSIDQDHIDLGTYLRRPYSARSPYYANYLRLFRGGAFLVTMPLVVTNATPNGYMYLDGDGEDPRFQVNRPHLEGLVREMLQKLRSRRHVPADAR